MQGFHRIYQAFTSNTSVSSQMSKLINYQTATSKPLLTAVWHSAHLVPTICHHISLILGDTSRLVKVFGKEIASFQPNP